MAKRLSGLNDLAYRGVNAVSPPDVIQITRAPSTGDTKNVNIGDIWIHSQINNMSDAYILVGLSGNVANWVKIGEASGTVESLTGNSGGSVGPTIGNINVVGDESTGITVVGTPGSSTLTISATGGTDTYEVQTSDATPTTLFSHTLTDDSAVTIEGQIITAKADYSSSGVGSFNGGARKPGAGASVLVGTPVISFSEDSGTGNPDIDIIVSGNDLILQVTGEVAITYNWEAFVRIQILDV